MDAIVSFINWLDDYIWGIPMIVLLLGIHLFMTARTGFIQRKTFTGIRLSAPATSSAWAPPSSWGPRRGVLVLDRRHLRHRHRDPQRG